MKYRLSNSLLGCMAAAAFSLATPSFAAVTMDEQGWTVITPSEDSRIVYVSSSEGNDDNDGLSPLTPKKSIVRAINLIRHGYPDHLLLKRGDVFPVERANLFLRFVSGRSKDEPVVISYYGDSGPRPVVKVSERFIDHDGQERDYQAIIGIDIYKSIADPLSPDFTNTSGNSNIRMVGGGKDILIEDCIVRFGAITIQSYDYKYSNPVVRRNIVVDSWGHNSYLRQGGAQGIFVSGVIDGYILEENFFDHCGWNEIVPNAGANMYNHNFYIQYSNCPGGIVRGNIVARGAAHGIQARSGGLVDRNLFILNAIALNMGGVHEPDDPAVLDFPNRATENVVISGRMMDPDNWEEPRTRALWGIHNAQYIPNVLFEDNIVANRIHSGSNQAYVKDGSPIMKNNISYKWAPADDNPIDPSWPHPDHDMGDYFATLGGENDTIAYLEWLRTRPIRTMPWEMTAYAGINYIREGFNKEPIEGYYVYPALAEAKWADWDRDENGNVDTGDFLGWIYVDGDYVWVWDLEGWIYLPESNVSEAGAWTFLFR